MAITTTSDLNSLFNNIYEMSKFVQEEEAMMPMLVNTRMAETMAPRILSTYGTQTAGTVAEGGTPTQTALTKTASGTVTPYKVHHQIALSDEDIMTDPDGAQQSAALTIGRAVARKIDSDLLALFDSFTKTKGTAGSALTLAEVAKAMAVLDADNTSMTGRSGVLHPYQWHDLVTQFTDVASNPVAAPLGDVANEVMRQYYVSGYLGARWFINSNLGTGTAVKGALFEREAILYDVRTPYRVEVERDPDTQSYRVNGVTRYGVSVDRDENGVALIGDATEPA